MAGLGIPVSWLDQSIDILSRVETPLDIGRPAREVFAYLIDFCRHVEWVHTYLSVEPLSPGPVRVGSQFRVLQKQDLRSDKLPFTSIAERPGEAYASDLEVTVVEADRRIAWNWQATDRAGSGEWQILLEPVTEDITRVRVSARLTSPRDVLEAWMHELQESGHPLDIEARQVDRALHNLRAILEGRAGPMKR